MALLESEKRWRKRHVTPLRSVADEIRPVCHPDKERSQFPSCWPRHTDVPAPTEPPQLKPGALHEPEIRWQTPSLQRAGKAFCRRVRIICTQAFREDHQTRRHVPLNRPGALVGIGKASRDRSSQPLSRKPPSDSLPPIAANRGPGGASGLDSPVVERLEPTVEQP
jgi:hypothetical protein